MWVLPDKEEDEEEEGIPPGPSPCPDASAALIRIACVSATPCTHRMAARMNEGTLRQARTRPGGAPELARAPVATMGHRGLGGSEREAGEKVPAMGGPVEEVEEEEASCKELPGRLRPYWTAP